MGAFCNKVLEALGYETELGSIDHRIRRIKTRLTTLETRVIMIDEVQHGIHFGSKTRRHFLNTIKAIENWGVVRLVALGTSEALNLFDEDPQIRRRFEYEYIAEWALDKGFVDLLVAYERRIPLLRPSELSAPATVKLLFDRSRGNFGRLALLISRAAEIAIKSGEERMTESIIKKVRLHTVADERRQSA